MKKAQSTEQCAHGSLKRSCEICERDAEIARLRTQVATEYCRGRDHEAAARADAAKPIEPTRSRMSVIARFIRNQVSLADRPPTGCIQLSNDEALLCAEALERVTGDVTVMPDNVCPNCGVASPTPGFPLHAIDCPTLTRSAPHNSTTGE